MQVYHYDPNQSNLYVSTTDVHDDGFGNFPIPANATTNAVPSTALPDGHVWCYQGDKWTGNPDHRGKLMHNGKEMKEVTFIGELPEGWSLGKLPSTLEELKMQKRQSIAMACQGGQVGGVVFKVASKNRRFLCTDDFKQNLMLMVLSNPTMDEALENFNPDAPYNHTGRPISIENDWYTDVKFTPQQLKDIMSVVANKWKYLKDAKFQCYREIEATTSEKELEAITFPPINLKPTTM